MCGFNKEFLGLQVFTAFILMVTDFIVWDPLPDRKNPDVSYYG